MADNMKTITSLSTNKLITNKNIEFLETSFVKLEDSDRDKELNRRAFVDSMRQCMANFNAQEIDTFSLVFSSPTSFRQDIENCIRFASARGVKDLSLDFHNPIWSENDLQNRAQEFTLSTEARHYDWTALKSLKLFSCWFPEGDFHNFAGLKQLSLGWIELSLVSLRSLLDTYCPLLESLSLKKCWNNDDLLIPARNTRLETLVIDKCNFGRSLFRIDTRNLRVFKYCGRAGLFDFFGSPQSMVEAELDFAPNNQFDFEDTRILLHHLLEQLFSVRVLTVCSFVLQVVPSGVDPFKLSTPLQVRHLSLKTAVHMNEVCGIMFMLNNCPVVDTLTIHIGPATIFNDPNYNPPCRFNPQEFWTKHLLVCECIERTLRVVEVKGFRGSSYELLLLKYLVGFGSVMEELCIHVSEKIDANCGNHREGYYFERAQLVHQFTKASDNLQISITR